MAKRKFKTEKEELPRTLSIFPYQTGSVKNIFVDASKPALTPGKRISKSGNVYWESRKNRSDAPGKNI